MCEAAGPGRGAQLAGRGRQPPSLSPPSASPPARDLTSFAFGTKQASGTHVSITPGGARRRGVSRRMSRGHSKPPPSPGASRGSWDSGGHRGHIPTRVTGRIPPGAGGSAVGARIAVSGLGSPNARGWFPRPHCASHSVTCLQLSTGFCQRRGAAPPRARPRRWQLRDRESRRAGGLPGSRASRAPGSAPSLRPRELRAFRSTSSRTCPRPDGSTDSQAEPTTLRAPTRTPSSFSSPVDAPGVLSRGCR